VKTKHDFIIKVVVCDGGNQFVSYCTTTGRRNITWKNLQYQTN
jgi:hypothetical protein